MTISYLTVAIIILMLIATNLATIICMRGKTDKLLENEKQKYDKEKKEFLHSTLRPMQEKEEQKFRMAEANLKLLEHQEELKRQKLEMAEANLQLLELKEQVEQEKERSDRLLLNVLPERVANDLKEKGSSIPECFDNVTVFFSDIVNFTRLTSTIDPADVICELSDIFTGFDRIFKRNHCERIKTIGDAYLSVSGMPEPDEKHACNVLKAAFECMEFLEKRNENHRMKWQMRMGVHSGRVVGGIVGIEKYIYDVFGDTINTAARMEHYSEPNKINVSSETYTLAREHFTFKERGSVEVKGKGLITMYFLEGVNP
ncbi:MAG: adenylate/guanylate cyclase domain-containing protein [Lentisphaerota bacterium]